MDKGRLCGSGLAGLMKMGGEGSGEWKIPWDIRLLRVTLLAPQDSSRNAYLYGSGSAGQMKKGGRLPGLVSIGEETYSLAEI